MTDARSGDESLDEIVSVMMAQKTGNRLHVPQEVLGAQVESLIWFMWFCANIIIERVIKVIRPQIGGQI